MAFVTIEDFTGRVELLVFSACYAKRRGELQRDAAVIAEGRISTREEEEPKVIVENVVPLASAYHRFVERVVIGLSTPGLEEEALRELRSLLEEHPGRTPVDLRVKTADGSLVRVSADGLKVEPTRELVDELGRMLGESNVSLEGAVPTEEVPEPAF